MRVQTDSDWAANKDSRRSVSGGALFIGGHLVKSWSKEQPLTAMSTAEAELYAANLGGQQVIGLRSLLRDVGMAARIDLEIDASAAAGIINREGLGRTRHIDVRYLWFQGKVRSGEITLHKIPGEYNTADLGTKIQNADSIQRHVKRMGFIL